MRDLITAAVKTAVQAGVGALVAYLLSLGIDIGDAAASLETGLFMAIMAAVSFGLNALGQKFPIVNKIISFGLSGSTASY